MRDLLIRLIKSERLESVIYKDYVEIRGVLGFGDRINQKSSSWRLASRKKKQHNTKKLPLSIQTVP